MDKQNTQGNENYFGILAKTALDFLKKCFINEVTDYLIVVVVCFVFKHKHYIVMSCTSSSF